MKQIDENNKQEILKEFLTDQELKYFLSACETKAKKMQKTLTHEFIYYLILRLVEQRPPHAGFAETYQSP